MKHVLVATSAALFLTLASATQALPLKEVTVAGGSFAATAAAAEVSGNPQASARPTTAGANGNTSVAADVESAPINPYALAAAGLMAVAFLARHRPARD